MPELPEVEVVKLFLEAKLLHKKITKLEILTPKSFIGKPSRVVGQTITGFSRIGKQLSIHLSNKLILLVHLKMTGQLIYHPALSREGKGKGLDSRREGDYVLGHPTKDALINLPNKSTRIIFYFSPLSSKRGTKGEILYFNDQRKFGWVRLLTRTELAEAQKDLGLDIFSPQFTPQYLFNQLQKSSRPVKLVLLDQHFFAGIGNIYANDALFLSKIHPSTPSNIIKPSKALSLYRSILSIMQQSVLAGGSTARDNKYIKPDGTKGLNQFHFRVYQRDGQPCLKCSTPIKKIRLGGRGTFYCPHCQM
jgi:formamidopyrimidine-DNA glycosylase